MTPDLAIAWLIFNVILVTITLIWGIFLFRRGIWYRKLSLKVQAYLLWGIGGIALLSSMSPFTYLYIEHLWFVSVNYAHIFWKIIRIRWGLFFGFFLVALVFMNLNAVIAKRLCPEPREFSRWTHQRTVSFHRTFFIGTVLLAILFAIPMMSLHNDFILYIGQPAEPDVVPANKILTGWGHIKNMDQPIEPELVPANLKENQRPTSEILFFGKDINFYLFSFPIHQAVSLWVEILLWVTCGVVGLLYNFYYRRDARSMGYVKRNIVFHGSVLWLMLLVVNIWRINVYVWGKVYKPPISKRLSELHGLFYVDVALAGATQFYFGILLIIIVALILNLFWRKRLLWYTAIGVWVMSYLCLIHVYPLGVNLWAVDSQGESLEKESVYLEQHIQDTRKAFDLDRIKTQSYEKGFATLDTINRNEDVKKNIQFWDRRVLYNILRNEEIKRHHDFHPYTDVDRYHLGRTHTRTTSPEKPSDVESVDNTSIGIQNNQPENTESVEQYKQVMIAAREIDPDPGPKEWSELKLRFTHGYGVCVVPVNEVSSDNSPDLWVKGVPIEQKEGLAYPELEVKQPRIYYGEMTNDYVIVKTDKPEYNIEEVEGKINGTKPTSAEDVNAESTTQGYHYQGTGGVPLGGWFRRLCFAVRFASVRILRHSALVPESRLMFWRKIGTRQNERLVPDRLSHIAPFLDYDPDPYIVIYDEQLWWIVDFYVTSKHFPNAQFYADDTAPIEDNDLELYTEPRFKRFKKFNYIRNSGVAVVNAYNGNVNFYTDIDDEPITEIYRNAFPKLFKNIDEMPEGLRAHRRFPDYLTRIQAKMYGNYHVEEPETFFNKGNQWKIPMEAYYSETPNHEMLPYYAMLKLPGEEKAEFVNMIPFTPTKKDNFMKGWLIARCDPPNYGQRIVYTLPDNINVKGPKHVEDDIPKNPQLAELFRNWRPNKIIRGNLHVIPIEEGIFYVEPIYFERISSKETENKDPADPILHLPTLQTIVVKAADHELAADISFEVALQKVFLRQPPTAPTDTENKEKEPTLSEQFEELRKALEDFGKALKDAENGNGQDVSAKAAGNTKAGKKKKN